MSLHEYPTAGAAQQRATNVPFPLSENWLIPEHAPAADAPIHTVAVSLVQACLAAFKTGHPDWVARAALKTGQFR